MLNFQSIQRDDSVLSNKKSSLRFDIFPFFFGEIVADFIKRRELTNYKSFVSSCWWISRLCCTSSRRRLFSHTLIFGCDPTFFPSVFFAKESWEMTLFRCSKNLCQLEVFSHGTSFLYSLEFCIGSIRSSHLWDSSSLLTCHCFSISFSVKKFWESNQYNFFFVNLKWCILTLRSQLRQKPSFPKTFEMFLPLMYYGSLRVTEDGTVRKVL